MPNLRPVSGPTYFPHGRASHFRGGDGVNNINTDLSRSRLSANNSGVRIRSTRRPNFLSTLSPRFSGSGNPSFSAQHGPFGLAPPSENGPRSSIDPSPSLSSYSLHTSNPAPGFPLSLNEILSAQTRQQLADSDFSTHDFLDELVNRNFSSPALPLQVQRTETPPPVPTEPWRIPTRRSPWRSSQTNDDISYPSVLRPEHPDAAIPASLRGSFDRDNMPVTRRISRSSALSSDLDGDVVETHASGSEQRQQDARRGTQTDTNSSRKRKRAEPQQAKNTEKSIFSLQDGDSPFSDRRDTGVEVIDLGDTEDVPDLGVTEVEGNNVLFKGFQCVICMDDTSDLTVTHCGKSSLSSCFTTPSLLSFCQQAGAGHRPYTQPHRRLTRLVGHLFCGECLHSSLQIDTNKKICPICRQKVDVKQGTNGKFSAKTKGFYPLRLKLMPAKRRGKNAAR